MKTKASKWRVCVLISGPVFGIYKYQIPVPGLQQTSGWDCRLNGVRPSLNFPVGLLPGPLDGLRCLGFDTYSEAGFERTRVNLGQNHNVQSQTSGRLISPLTSSVTNGSRTKSNQMGHLSPWSAYHTYGPAHFISSHVLCWNNK